MIGATGVIGKEVIHQLVQAAPTHDIRIIAGARNVQQNSNFAAQGVDVCILFIIVVIFILLIAFQVVSIDMAKLESVEQALKGVDKIFLLSPFYPEMVQHAKNVAQVAKKVFLNEFFLY